MEQFYASVTTGCFLLMGLWWNVMQFRHVEWSQDPAARRMAYDVYLSFLLPGMMSMAAQIGGDLKFLWRAIFAVVGIMGLFNALWLLPRVAARYPHTWFIRYGRAFMAALYVLLVIVAVLPQLAGTIAPLKPVQLEGILLALILFVGINIAWEFMSQPKDEYSKPKKEEKELHEPPQAG